MEWLMQIAKAYGPFTALVVYVVWDSRQREHKYLAVIQTLSEEVKDRLTKIETTLRRKT